MYIKKNKKLYIQNQHIKIYIVENFLRKGTKD
jgi:hypothetical protein